MPYICNDTNILEVNFYSIEYNTSVPTLNPDIINGSNYTNNATFSSLIVNIKLPTIYGIDNPSIVFANTPFIPTGDDFCFLQYSISFIHLVIPDYSIIRLKGIPE